MFTTIILATVLAQQPQIASHDKQIAIMEQIKAARAAKGTPAVSPTSRPLTPPKSPSDMTPKERLALKKSRYRAFQANQDAREAAQAAADKAEAIRMLPFQLEMQRQQLNAATAKYQADQRLAGDRAIANGLKGVTAPPY